MSNCLFCKIIEGEVPSTKVYENEYVCAFKDINPAAPVHVLIVPKKHIDSIMEVEAEDAVYLQEIVKAAQEIAKEAGIADEGFRLINNCGEYGGQTVYHLHFHLIGGSKLGAKLV